MSTSKPITCSNCGAEDVTDYCLCGHCGECIKIMHPSRKTVDDYTEEDMIKLRKMLAENNGMDLKDAIKLLS